MDFQLLPMIHSPEALKSLSDDQLQQLAGEIRESLVQIVEDRPAHFSSNLGVVELCLALHQVFDFSKDRLIWDTGHQIYPHKLVTGRFPDFKTIRQRGGLMGYPNPVESDYDLFVTGHAGSSVSTVLGLAAGDALLRGEEGRKSVAVIGDGALPSGIVFEAMNNAAELGHDLLVVLNDNKMGICPRVGGLAQYLDRARTAPFYDGLKKDVSWFLNRLPIVGEQTHKTVAQFKEALKGFLHGGMLFEEMGFRYIGPVDGHDLPRLRDTLAMIKDIGGPVLLHTFTEKGHGFEPACENPTTFHTPSVFKRSEDGEVVFPSKKSSPAFTNVMSEAIHSAMAGDENVCVLTAAMCAGNDLGRVRDEYPDRFFDVGICEGHAVAFAGGMAKAGAKPIVDIYSTFLQRSFDQIFQEVALQNLPVVFTLDRAGLCGPDGPTHHGVFDNSYMRVFPNIAVLAPGDAADIAPMLDACLQHDGPSSIRYPKTSAETIDRPNGYQPFEWGKSEVILDGYDGAIIAFGALLPRCIEAAEKLRLDGVNVTVINARFLRPLDTDVILGAVADLPFVLTVEENTRVGGFGSVVLEAANDAGLNTAHIRRLALPDEFVEHGNRDELLDDIGLGVDGIYATALSMADRGQYIENPSAG